jgi:transcriptional regulator with XRE-family HTH domain
MIGSALRCIRIFHDLNQTDAAEKLGISRSYLSEIEGGAKDPTLQLLQRYAGVFRMPASSILFFCENFERPAAKEQARRMVSGKVLSLMRFLAERAERDSHAG